MHSASHRVLFLNRQSGVSQRGAIDLIVGALGASIGVRLPFGGGLFLVELVLVVMLPYLLLRSRPHSHSNLNQGLILLFGWLWLWSQLLSDLVHESTSGDMIR